MTGEGVPEWDTVQSRVFSVLKTLNSHGGPRLLPPHFLRLSLSFSRSNPTGLFAVLQLCRHMPPSRSLTFLFPLPGILSQRPPTHGHPRAALPAPPASHCPSHTLYLPILFLPRLCSVLTLFVRAPVLSASAPPSPPQGMWAPHGRNFSMLFLP